MKQKIKVLQSINSFGMGGNTIFAMQFFRHIDKEKFQIDFVIYDDTKMDFYQEVIDAGSRVFVCKSKYKNKYMRLYDQMRQVSHLLKHHHYDIIHCNSCSFVGIFRGAVPGYLIKGTKVITHSHSVGTPKNTICDQIIRNVAKFFLSHIVDMGFTCSDVAGDSKYTKKFMNSAKYVMIHNAVEVHKFSFDENNREELRKHYNIEGKLVIGNVGRLSHEKNQSFLIDILADVLRREVDAILIIVGGGELEGELKNKVKELELTNRVIFTGSVRDVERYYSAMDVFVMPSLYEGLPFTAIEAQVNSLNCIFSNRITQMADVTGMSKFLPLDAALDEWSESVIAGAMCRCNEQKMQDLLENYDLCREAKRVEHYYKYLKRKNGV